MFACIGLHSNFSTTSSFYTKVESHCSSLWNLQITSCLTQSKSKVFSHLQDRPMTGPQKMLRHLLPSFLPTTLRRHWSPFHAPMFTRLLRSLALEAPHPWDSPLTLLPNPSPLTSMHLASSCSLALCSNYSF